METYTAPDFILASAWAMDIYKSTDAGATFTLDKSVAISHSSSNADLLQMGVNKDGNVVVAYNNTAALPIYTMECIAGLWGTAISANGIGAIAMKMVSTPDTDYMFCTVSTTCYAYYLTNGVWTLITSFAVGGWVINAFATQNNTVLLFYVSGTTFTTMEFNGTSYLTAKALTSSLSAYGIAVTPGCTDYIYLWVWPNAVPSLWKPYKVTLGTLQTVYPLEISIKKNGNKTIRYESNNIIANPVILPKSLSLQAGSNSRASDIAVDVQSYSGFKLDSIEFTAEDSTYN